MKKEVALGDIAMYKWKKGDPLFPSWFEEEDKVKIDPKEAILEPNTDYKLCITYPLSRDFVQTISTKNEGMTREDFVELVVLCYNKIYEDEDGTSSIDASHIPGMYNRISTDGAYGIWGHDLSDLVLHTLHIKNNKLTLGVDS
jgi:hypothetical protein